MRTHRLTFFVIMAAILAVFLPIRSFADESYLRLGYFPQPNAVGNLDLATADSMTEAFFLKQVAQTLVDNDLDGKVIPSAAKNWSISSDMTTYKFTLFDNLFFHNGQALTSRDVVYSINLVKNSKINPISQYFQRIESLSIQSSNTFTIRLKKPWFGFLPCLSSALISIVPEGLQGNDFIGSGPYRLIRKGSSTFLEPFTQYHGPFPPKDIGYELVADSKDDVDLAMGWHESKSGSALEHASMDSFTAYYFVPNPEKNIWKDLRNRVALMKILLLTRDVIKSPNLKELDDIFPRGMRGFDINHTAYDLLQRNIAADAAVPKFSQPLTIASIGPIPRFKEFSKVAADRFGVQLINVEVTEADFMTQLKNTKADVFCFGWNSIFGHPDAVFLPFFILGIGEFNKSIDGLIEKASSATSLTDQFRAYRRLASQLIQDGFVLPHSQSMGYISYKPSVDVPKYRFRYTVPLSEIRRK